MTENTYLSDLREIYAQKGADLSELERVFSEGILAGVILDTYLEAIINMQIDIADSRRWTTEVPKKFIASKLRSAGLETDEESSQKVSDGVVIWSSGKINEYPSLLAIAKENYASRFL